MENAQLIGLSRQIALARQMDVVANNVANINTSGFKSEALLFEEYLMPIAEYSSAPIASDQDLSYTQDWATVHDFRAGSIVQTGNELDLALEGDGFFAVQTPEGEKWTRDGSFKLDNTGLLVTNNGYPVNSEGGEIRFEPNETDIRFNPDGSITSSAGLKGNMRIVRFDNPQALTREGFNLFAGGEPIATLDNRVMQGAVERSNVSGVTEIANMIRVQRAYESVGALLDRQNELRESAIQRLASLNG